jgi:hypothetical protein
MQAPALVVSYSKVPKSHYNMTKVIIYYKKNILTVDKSYLRF